MCHYQVYSTRLNIRNMQQYIYLQYRTKHQKYVPVSIFTVHDKTSEICSKIQLYSTRSKNQKYVLVYSCTVHDQASDICASIYLYITWRNIIHMCQYLVVRYIAKHRKQVSVSSRTVYDETSSICASVQLYSTR